LNYDHEPRVLKLHIQLYAFYIEKQNKKTTTYISRYDRTTGCYSILRSTNMTIPLFSLKWLSTLYMHERGMPCKVHVQFK